MQKLIYLVGLPCSGKTTLSKKLEEEHNAIAIHVDEIRNTLLQDGDPDYVLKAFDVMKQQAKEKLENGLSVIVDSTNPTKEIRMQNLSILDPEHKYQRYAYFLNTPYDVCVKRTVTKNYPIDNPIMELVSKKLQKPALEEGFDIVEEVNYKEQNKDLDTIINLFLEQKGLKNNEHVLAVFAFGSQVTKTNSKNSDLDLQIIFDSPINKRGALKVNSTIVEYYYNSIESIINLESLCYDNNELLFYNIFKNIRIYKNKNNTIENIKKTLDETFHYDSFKPKNNVILTNDLIMAYNRLLDLKVLKQSNNSEFYHLYYLTLERIKNFYCDALCYNRMKEGKYQKYFNNSPNYKFINRVDSDFETMFKNCFLPTTTGDNLQKITKLFNYVIKKSPIKLNFNNYELDFNQKNTKEIKNMGK